MWKRTTHNLVKHTLTYNTHEQQGQHNFEFSFLSSMGVPLARGLFPRGPTQPSTPPPTPAAEPIQKPPVPPWRKGLRVLGFTRTSEPPKQRMSGSHDSRCYQNGGGCVCTGPLGSACTAASLFHPVGAAPVGATAVQTPRDLYTFGQSQAPAQLPAETVPVTFTAPVVGVSISTGYIY